MKYLHIMSLLAASFLCAFSANAESSMKEGKWDVTTKMTMKGMDPEMAAFASQGMTTRAVNCLTNENPVPQQDDSGCSAVKIDRSGNTIRYEMTCDSADFKGKTSGQMTYTGDTMKGFADIQETGGEGMDMHLEFDGKYVGPC